MVLVEAIFDYNGSADHQIQFLKGDIFELIDDTDPNWWHVTLPKSPSVCVPEHIYVPSTYVKKLTDGFDSMVFDLPPPPTDAELASISVTNLDVDAQGATAPTSDWKSHVDKTGRVFYFNSKTQVSQWKQPDEMKGPPMLPRRAEEQVYATLLPKQLSEELRTPVNAAAVNEHYANLSYKESPAKKHNYANLGKCRERYCSNEHSQVDTLDLDLQSAGQTTCNENTQRDRKHSSPSSGTMPSSPGFIQSPVNNGGRGRVLDRTASPVTSRPYSIVGTASTLPASLSHSAHHVIRRQHSDNQVMSEQRSSSVSVSKMRRSLKKTHSLNKSRKLSEELRTTTVHSTSVTHGNSSFHDNTISISGPRPTIIPTLGCECMSVCTCGLAPKEFISNPIPITKGHHIQQILEGYTEDRVGDDVFYICKNTNEKWKLVRNPGEDKVHYFNPLTGERVWSLPAFKAFNRTFSNPAMLKNPKALDKRSKSLSDCGRSPVIKCEGILKRKITKTPPDVKSVEKSWASFYTVLKSNTIFFYKDIKYFKRDEYESACDLTKEATVEMEPERKGVKLIRVSKENGLEMLLRIKTENQTGVKCSSFESWLENLCLSTGSPCTAPGIKNSQNSVSTSDIASSPDNQNGTNRHVLVDRRSIIDCKEITKKDISEFLNRKMEKHSNSKSSIQKLLEDQGIDISHLDKSKKKEVLNRLLTSRPSFSDLEKKGLIKYTVFGCPLSKLCSRQKVLVPSVVTQCIEAIEHRGLKSAGIYRISGNSASIQKLRFKFDKEEPVDLKDDEYDINMLTGSLKLFLRELPEPIIPFRQFAAVESAIRGGDSNQQDCLGSLKQIVHDLPEPNKSTFKYIILHIVRVAHESDNQMDDHNLSIIFGPSLLGNYPDKANLLVDLPVQNNAIEKIISNFKTIFR